MDSAVHGVLGDWSQSIWSWAETRADRRDMSRPDTDEETDDDDAAA